jgi:hypothetical protein
MKTNLKTISLILGLALAAIMQGCKKEDALVNQSDSTLASKSDLQLKDMDNHSNTYYGPAVHIGRGMMKAWVRENQQGDPVAVGIVLSKDALRNLPLEDAQYVLSFPKNKGHNFYKHMLIDWNAHGHEPAGVYDLPHFDFHFYTISSSERMLIGDDPTLFANAPAPQFIPPAYMQIPGGVPQMGAHWADLLSPEFNGGVFTKTFIWGSYDGSFIFWEPMITRAYLLSHPDEVIPLRQPLAYEHNGWYATDYKITYNHDDRDRERTGYVIALINLTFREGETN